MNDGLPSSKVYDMMQDAKGYMWFATENGVARFDGYDFKVFTAQDGLPNNSTLKLYQDYKGRIWFLSYSGNISYYDNEKITEHWINDSVTKLNINFFDNIYVDTLDNVCLSVLYGGIYKLSNSIEFIGQDDFRSCKKNCTYSIYLEDHIDGYVLGIVSTFKESVKEKMMKTENGCYHYFSVPVNYLFQHKKYCKVNKDKYYISLGDKLRLVENESFTSDKKFSSDILSVYVDNSNNLWISLNFDGVYMYPDCNLEVTPEHYLQGQTVSKILQDGSGTYWFSTTENGVYLVPSFDFKNYSSHNIGLKNEIIYSMGLYQNNVFFTTENRKIYSLKIVNETPVDVNEIILDGIVNSNINDVMVDSEGTLWVTSSSYLHYSKIGERIFVDSIQQIFGYDFAQLYDNSIMFAFQGGINLFNNGKRIYLDDSISSYSRIFSIHQMKDSTIWLGSLYGLKTFENNRIERYTKDDPVLNTRISDINSTSSQLWVGTFDNGLAIVSGDSIDYVDETGGLSSNRVKVIFVENDHHIWIGTNKGLNHIIVDEFANNKYSNVNYTIWDGLPSNEINDIVKIDDIIWLATDKGFVSFRPASIEKLLYPPQLFIEKITINDRKVSEEFTHHNFSFDENSISINFKAINFIDPSNLNYYYKLDGLENEWLKTKNRSVRFPDLVAGNYNFIVKAKNIDGVWSKPAHFSFRIEQHYSKTVFFIIGMILLGVFIVFLIVYSILITIKNRENLKRQVLLAEQTAIRSQMNPHFIFNSLNSIQSFIIQQDAQSANLYLANLSNLMRRILDNSKQMAIPLREEIENIRLYLDLEKFRFEKHFNYKIEIDPSIKLSDVVIPSMIIQPYLENAIWHGLVPKEEMGLLKMTLRSLGDSSLLVIVEDNGIGRDKAGHIAQRRKNYKSMGMKNTRERIDLLNKLYSMNMTVKVLDLFDDRNDASGTRVELVFEK